MMMLPENVVSSRKALPSPTTPRTERRHRPRSASPLLPNEKSERMEPLKDVASTSNPALPRERDGDGSGVGRQLVAAPAGQRPAEPDAAADGLSFHLRRIHVLEHHVAADRADLDLAGLDLAQQHAAAGASTR